MNRNFIEEDVQMASKPTYDVQMASKPTYDVQMARNQKYEARPFWGKEASAAQSLGGWKTPGKCRARAPLVVSDNERIIMAGTCTCGRVHMWRQSDRKLDTVLWRNSVPGHSSLTQWGQSQAHLRTRLQWFHYDPLGPATNRFYLLPHPLRRPGFQHTDPSEQA